MLHIFEDHVWKFVDPREWTFSVCLVCKKMNEILNKYRLYKPYSISMFARDVNLFRFALRRGFKITNRNLEEVSRFVSPAVARYLLELMSFRSSREFIWAYEYLEFTGQVRDLIVAHGDISQIDSHLHEGHFRVAIESRNMPNFRYLLKKFGAGLGTSMIEDIVRNGATGMLRLVACTKEDITIDLVYVAMHRGYLNMLFFLLKKDLCTMDIVVKVIGYIVAHTSLADILYAVGNRYVVIACAEAYKIGRQDVANMLSAKLGMYLTTRRSPRLAITYGLIESLQYLHEEGEEIPNDIVMLSISCNHPRILEWALDHGFSDDCAYYYAMRFNSIEMCEILRSRGILIGQELPAVAAETGSLDMFIWFFERQMVSVVTAIEHAIKHDNLHIAEWIARRTRCGKIGYMPHKHGARLWIAHHNARCAQKN